MTEPIIPIRRDVWDIVRGGGRWWLLSLAVLVALVFWLGR